MWMSLTHVFISMNAWFSMDRDFSRSPPYSQHVNLVWLWSGQVARIDVVFINRVKSECDSWLSSLPKQREAIFLELSKPTSQVMVEYLYLGEYFFFGLTHVMLPERAWLHGDFQRQQHNSECAQTTWWLWLVGASAWRYQWLFQSTGLFYTWR